MNVCDLPVALEVELECLASSLVNVTRPGDAETPTMGFVFYNGKLAGITSRTLTADVAGPGRHIRVLMLNVAFRHGLLLDVLYSSQVSAELSATERTYCASAVQFLFDGVLVDCGGVTIAADAILTTATCALAHRPTACIVDVGAETQASTAATNCVIRPEATVIHPLYQQQSSAAVAATPPRFDFVILKLTSFRLSGNVVALAQQRLLCMETTPPYEST